jgi:hypothetical protein
MFFRRKKHHKHKYDIIPLSEAISETKAWRDKYADELGGIKGFFIPMEDLKRLVKKYKKFKPSGARAYIGYKSDIEYGSKLRLILVPATLTEDFFDVGPHDPLSTGESSAYDFTMPCPDSCAAENPLNSDTYNTL